MLCYVVLYCNIVFYVMLYYILKPEVREMWPGADRGQREHEGSFRGYPNTGGGAVFS